MGTPLITDDLLNTWLDWLEANGDVVQVRTSSATNLIGTVALDAGNYGVTVDGAVDGRRMSCLVSDSSDLDDLGVSVNGTATDVAILDAATLLVVFDITGSDVPLTTSDKIDINAAYLTIRDV